MTDTMQWRPIETAPMDGSDVLLYWKWRGIGVGSWHQPDGCTRHWCIGKNWTPGSDPLYWMPLPAPPKDAE